MWKWGNSGGIIDIQQRDKGNTAEEKEEYNREKEGLRRE